MELPLLYFFTNKIFTILGKNQTVEQLVNWLVPNSSIASHNLIQLRNFIKYQIYSWPLNWFLSQQCNVKAKEFGHSNPYNQSDRNKEEKIDYNGATCHKTTTANFICVLSVRSPNP